MRSPGRNDPCPCGSGKKYKNCHLQVDERKRFNTRRAPAPSPTPFASPTSFKNAQRMLARLPAGRSSEARRELDALIARTEPILEYLESQEEIEAASHELEAHRTAFEQWIAQPERITDLASALFSEECFAPLHFSAADVRRAFDHVGYPAMMSPDAQAAKILRAAILHLADQDKRNVLSMKLLALLPQFVTAGRLMEAWLIRYSAYLTAAEQDESNPFLFQMFAEGYAAWAAQRRAHDTELLRQLGFDPERLASMTMDEIDQWLAAQGSDPAKNKELESFFQKHPDLRAESVANLEALQRGSTKLLERDDCQFLLLSSEEIEPWLHRFNDRFAEAPLNERTFAEPASEQTADRLFQDVVLPLLREMTQTIFTRDRIHELVCRLKAYRSEKFTTGERDIATTATGAIQYLEREDQPSLNTFLITLCWASLSRLFPESAGSRVPLKAQ